MVSFTTRKPAPAWPPLKDSYKRLGKDEDIQLMLKSDIDTSYSHGSGFYSTPTPWQTTFPEENVPARFGGWRGGAKIAFTGAVSVLAANVIILIAMSTGFKHMDGMAMIFIGSCTTTERINTGIHFLVNVLSTGLLAASSFCMQILTAPTREDIDRAHARGTWLDIGIASIRNLRILRKQKVVLWWLLVLSTVPLHLFYNSVFFAAIATNDYNVLYATEGFVSGAAYDKSKFPDTIDMNVTDLQYRSRAFERLDNSACIKAYALDFVTDRKDVVVIVRGNGTTPASSLLNTTTNEIPHGGFNYLFDSFAWICNDPDTPAATNNNRGAQCSKMSDKLATMANQEWRSGGYDIAYCLSETIVPDCHVHFAPQIMAPVLFFNILKAAIIAYVAFFYKDKPIVTLGDAIESFSLQPDPTTQGMCLATPQMIEGYWVKGYTSQPIQYDGQGRRWWQSATWRQYLTFGSVFTFAAVSIVIGIILGVNHSEPKTLANAWKFGIGKVRTQNLMSGLQTDSLGANAVFVSALIANSPQTIFSFIYLIYNNIFTTMVLSDEWDRFSIKSGKGRILRVSEPRGNQRSTYFLQIPYRYALVMLTTSGLLHWLVSQSVFLANISVIPLDGIKPKQDEITTCAYSVKAMMFILILGVFMLCWLFGNGMRRFSGGMPFVGSNSAAISAACHSQYALKCEREAMVLKPLRWGVTDYGSRKTPKTPKTPYSDKTPKMPLSGFDKTPRTMTTTESQSNRSGSPDWRDPYEEDYTINGGLMSAHVGHCTFTDGRVAKPVHGRLYA